MSQTLSIPDDIYAGLSHIAAEQGRAVEDVAVLLLKRSLQNDSKDRPALDWETANAEEIIANLRARHADEEDTGLATLDPKTGHPLVPSHQLRGIALGDGHPPSDEDVERWRMEKYGE